jgi:hypothetical protein
VVSRPQPAIGRSFLFIQLERKILVAEAKAKAEAEFVSQLTSGGHMIHDHEVTCQAKAGCE